MIYAHDVHQGQFRKGTGIPYIAHVLGVAAIAMEYGADEDEAIGALLHDAAEDGGGEATLAEIRARFGDAVGDIVLGCSDSLVEDPEDKLPWRDRKENYLAHLDNASQSVCLVSAADKLHNVRSITRDYHSTGMTSGCASWAGVRGRSGTDETVAHVLVRRYHSHLTRDLQIAVDQLLALGNNK